MQQLAQTYFADQRSVTAPKTVVVIGAATGGPTALTQIIPKLPRNMDAAIVVVQQMRPGFTRLLAEHLNGLSEMPIGEPVNTQRLGRGEVVISPGQCSIEMELMTSDIERQCVLQVKDVSEVVERLRRRVDDAMASAAAHYGSRAVGVLLTGVGEDGRQGMTAIRNAGGRTIVQDEASSIVFDMPRAAIDAGVVDEIVPLWSIADRIVEIVGEA